MIINTPTKTLVIALVAAATLVAAASSYYLLARPDKPRGAVVTNGARCASIGRSIFERGGHAVEAAIAALFCEGVSMPQSAGIGGGFLMTIYDRAAGSAVVLDARETAPGAARRDMYHGDEALSSRGSLSVAVPGELRGYWRAYRRFGGTVPWRDLVQPTIDLCKNGIPVTAYLEQLFRKEKERLYANPTLRSSYINPITNDTYKEGQVVKRPLFARTLEVIAAEGGDALHNGSLTDDFIEDIRSMGGIITREDMENYEPKWQDPIRVELYNETLYTVPLPGSGALLAYMLNMFKQTMDFGHISSLLNYQKMVESFKYAYGMRTRLGDIGTKAMNEFELDLASDERAAETVAKMSVNSTSQDPREYGALLAKMEDHGTAHISIVSPLGDAVSVTSTINLYFGSGISANHSDIILNDEMDDFSSPDIVSHFDIPASPANFIAPGKRPLSSMCPSVVVDRDGEVALAIGAAGGTKITTITAYVIAKHLWFGLPLHEAIDACRLHHQLFPMEVQIEGCFLNSTVVSFLEGIGHAVEESSSDGFSALTAVTTRGGIAAASDKRRPGEVAYIY